jgi:hypothetical protein
MRMRAYRTTDGSKRLIRRGHKSKGGHKIPKRQIRFRNWETHMERDVVRLRSLYRRDGGKRIWEHAFTA